MEELVIKASKEI